MSTASSADADPIRALERGNWRTAIDLLRQVDPAATPHDVLLGADLRTIARSMARRAAGDHGEAWTTLAIASSSLHRRQPNLPVVPSNGTGVVRLALPPEPDAGSAAHRTFRTVRLIWREQSELARLRHQAGERPAGLTADRYVLVLAFVEYLCWLQFDTGTWLAEIPADEEAAAVDDSIAEFLNSPRDCLLRSATDVRRLHRPAAGGMTRAVWDRANQYRGLRRLAMLELARRPAPPWTEQSKQPNGVPARTGARLAWQAARET